MTNQPFFQTAASTKWIKMANMGRQTNISVTSRPFKSFKAIAGHASPVFAIFCLSLLIFMLLLDTSGGFWWCEGGIATPFAIRV